LAGGQHLGGTIGAGLKLTRTALHHYTAQLPLTAVKSRYTMRRNRRATLWPAGDVGRRRRDRAIHSTLLFVTHERRERYAAFIFLWRRRFGAMAQCQQAPDLEAMPMRHAPALCLLGLLAM